MPYSEKSKQSRAQQESDERTGKVRLTLTVSVKTKRRWLEAKQASGLTADRFLTKLLQANKMITLLNTSILTSYGNFSYKEITLDQAKNMIIESCAHPESIRKLIAQGKNPDAGQTVSNDDFWQSAIGHESTAKILTKLLGVKVPVSRQQYQQRPGEAAIVFKLNGRPEEGKILSEDEIEAIGYKFGIIEIL